MCVVQACEPEWESLEPFKRPGIVPMYLQFQHWGMGIPGNGLPTSLARHRAVRFSERFCLENEVQSGEERSDVDF